MNWREKKSLEFIKGFSSPLEFDMGGAVSSSYYESLIHWNIRSDPLPGQQQSDRGRHRVRGDQHGQAGDSEEDLQGGQVA